MSTQNLMSATLTSIIKTALDARAESDKDFADNYTNPQKSITECIDKIYSALEKLARENRNGASCVATCGSDEVLVSAAIHYYDEEDATEDSISAIIKSGTEVHANGKQKEPKAESKPKASKPKAKAATTETPKPVSAPAPKKVPAPMTIVKPSPKPAPKAQEEDDDLDDFCI